MKSYRSLALECGLGFNTIAGYCSGRHLPQLSVGVEFQRLLTALGIPPGAEQDAWLENRVRFFLSDGGGGAVSGSGAVSLP